MTDYFQSNSAWITEENQGEGLSLPDNRYLIFSDLRISGENWHIFHLSLGDQYAIKGILVVNGQR
jgi:hypothetical protein